jgi:hypothetical protein
MLYLKIEKLLVELSLSLISNCTYADSSRLSLIEGLRESHCYEVATTHVQSAYKKPQKQNAAMTIKKTNCMIMARKDNTIKLSLKVTKASLREVKESEEKENEYFPGKHKACY